jgi:uncharacterized cupredoxin-like copper-binding protein
MVALLAACGGGGEDDSDAGAATATVVVEETAEPADDGAGAGATTVGVVMKETEEGWAFELDRTEVPAGEVTFEVTNEGKLEHELMIYPPQDLSHMLAELVAAAETGEEDAHEEEEEDAHGEEIEGLVMSLEGEDELVLEPDESGSFTVNLAPGSYELGCVIVETIGGETFTHYEKGMHTTLTVE